jgi:transcriptional regulator with XRE-family HTH domain
VRQESELSTIVATKMSANGWTLKEVADRAGLSVGTVWAIREGIRGRRPNSFTLIKLAQGLDLPPEELFAALDHGAPRERAHLRVYRQLSRANQLAVDALAVRLLADQQPASSDTVRLA